MDSLELRVQGRLVQTNAAIKGFVTIMNVYVSPSILVMIVAFSNAHRRRFVLQTARVLTESVCVNQDLRGPSVDPSVRIIAAS